MFLNGCDEMVLVFPGGFWGSKTPGHQACTVSAFIHWAGLPVLNTFLSEAISPTSECSDEVDKNSYSWVSAMVWTCPSNVRVLRGGNSKRWLGMGTLASDWGTEGFLPHSLARFSFYVWPHYASPLENRGAAILQQQSADKQPCQHIHFGLPSFQNYEEIYVCSL